MANVLQMEKKIMVIGALAEGNSIRSIERMTGVHRDTIMRLGISVGQGCAATMNETMKDLNSTRIEVDEIWGYVGMKQRHTDEFTRKEGMGDAWTFVAIDSDSKAVPCFHVGLRDMASAQVFMNDLAGRLKNRVQLCSDSMHSYMESVKEAFGDNVDYAQLIKTYSSPVNTGRYSPSPLVKMEKESKIGNPDMFMASTSYIERQNLTMRMHIRRLTRLTNAFSKKLDNFKAAIGLHFGYYNFVKRHTALRRGTLTPAMKAGVTDRIWTIADLIERAA